MGKQLETDILKRHLELAKKELTETKTLINTEKNDSNFAYFELIIITNDNSIHQIFDKITKRSFKSGGERLINAVTYEFYAYEDLHKKIKSLEDKIRSLKKNLMDMLNKDTRSIDALLEYQPCQPDTANATSQIKKKARTEDALNSLIDSIRKGQSELSNEKSKEKTWHDQDTPNLFKQDNDATHQHTKYMQGTHGVSYEKHMYDSEQNIIKIVDYYLSNAIIDQNIIKINNKIFKRNEIKAIMLNIHTRFDMCQFCSMFLAYSLKKWQKILSEINIIAIVTSRQEYRDTAECLNTQSYYQGMSMRSFTWRKNDDGTLKDDASNIEGIIKIAQEGLVMQYAIAPQEIYA